MTADGPSAPSTLPAGQACNASCSHAAGSRRRMTGLRPNPASDGFVVASAGAVVVRSGWCAGSMFPAHTRRQGRAMNTSHRCIGIEAHGAMRSPQAASGPDHADDRTCWTVAPAAVWRTKLSAISRPVWGARPMSSESLGLRFGVWRRSVQLDRALAEGVPAARRADLELRAQQLASARVRCSLARGFRAVVADSEWSPAAPTLVPRMLFSLVAALPGAASATRAGDTLLEIADALAEPGCTSVQGIAHASWLLCDVSNSPLYARLSARTLQRIAREAVAALHGDR